MTPKQTELKHNSSPARPVGRSQEVLWHELVKRHEPNLKNRIRGTLLRLGSFEPDEAVDDLAQEVFRRLLSHHGRSLTEGPARCELTFAAYLGKTAESAVIDRLRYRRAAKRDLNRGHSLSHPWIEAEALRHPDPAADPEQRVMQRQAVVALVKRLRAGRGSSAGCQALA